MNAFARRNTVLLLATATTLALTGCSGDGDDASLQASATEYAFTPTAWTVTAGEAFDVTLTNVGVVEHEWAVIKLGEDLDSEEDFTEDKVLFEVEKIAAGTDTTQTFTVDAPGTYQVVCALEGHFDQGMEGTLVVE